MKIKNLLTICGVAAALTLSVGSSFAQNDNGGGGNGGGNGGDNGGGQRRQRGGGNFDPAQMQQRMLQRCLLYTSANKHQTRFLDT